MRDLFLLLALAALTAAPAALAQPQPGRVRTIPIDAAPAPPPVEAPLPEAGAAASPVPSAGSAAVPGRALERSPAALAAAAAVPSRPVPAPASVSTRETLAVLIDHAKVVRLPDRTQTVIVGNPSIADVTVQKNGILVVTAKSYGVTNMIALDAGGAMLAESLISVQAPSESLVTVQRGFERESYSCTPSCQPSVLLGDSQKHFGEVSGQASARNGLAGGAR